MADNGMKPRLQLLQTASHSNPLRCLHDPVLSDGGVSVLDVAKDRIMQEEDILVDNTDATAEFLQVEPISIHPMYDQTAVLNPVEPQQQFEQRRFAAARLPFDGIQS